jgi:hypothetical protein
LERCRCGVSAIRVGPARSGRTGAEAQQERVRRRLDELRSEATDGLGPTPVEEPVKTASAPVRPDLAGPTRIADAPQRQRSNSADLDLGGGAVDPLSAGIAAALAGLGLARLRRRR